MKDFSKVIGFILTLILAFNMTVVAAVPADVEGTEYEQAIRILSALGIIEGFGNESFKPQDAITRAEFTVLITNLCGFSELAKEKLDTQFHDVKADYWASGNIDIAVKQAIISGYDDGSFNPEGSVTFEQAVKMLVCALGYELYAQTKGGYPTGYMMVASERGLSKDVDVQMGVSMTRGQAALLIYNALDVDMMKPTGFGANLTYKIISGKTLLSEKLQIQKETGIITGTSETKLTNPKSMLWEDEIEIDNVIYQIQDTGVKELLGQRVTFYYKEDTAKDTKTILYIEPEKDRNTVLTIKAEDIMQVTGNTITYEVNEEDEEKAAISNKTDVIYNGKAYLEYAPSDLKPLAGVITLIDNDGNNDYDVVIVKAYDTYVVDSVDTLSSKVLSKYNKSNVLLELDEDSTDYVLKILKNGKPIALSAIKTWDVLTVMESKNIPGDNFKTVLVSSQSVKGIITETSDETRYVDETEYELAQSYIAYMEADTGANELGIGVEGTFYLDIEGKIAAANTTVSLAGGKEYGYLVNAAVGKAISHNAKFRILDTKGQVNDYKADDEISLNGETQDTEAILTTASAVYGNEGILRQLIIYEVNGNGEVISIDTPSNNPAKPLVTYTRFNGTAGDGLRYRSESYSFGGNFRISSNTIIFMVPPDLEDTDAYAVVPLSRFVSYFNYNVIAYNLSKGRVAPVMVVYDKQTTDDGSRLSSSQAFATVDRIVTVINEEGDKASKIYVVQNGKEAEVMVPAKGAIAGKVATFKQGDVFQYNLNSKNEISNMMVRLVYDPQKADSIGTAQSSAQFAYGKIFAKDGTDIVIDTARGAGAWSSTTAQGFNISKAKVTLFDTKKKEVSVAAVSDVGVGCQVFMRVRYDVPMDILIIK